MIEKPLSQKNITRILLLLVLGLALAAGFYQSALVLQQKKYQSLGILVE